MIHSVFLTYHPNTTELDSVQHQYIIQTNFSFKLNNMGFYRNHWSNDLICIFRLFRKSNPRLSHLYYTSKKIRSSWRTFTLKTLSELNLSACSSAKYSLGKNITMLDVKRVLEKLPIRLALDWNLTLNCKHKDLPKFVFNLENIWKLHWVISKKME